MKTIAVVTVARSDFGILTPVLHAIEQAPDLELKLIVSGAHLDAAHGATAGDIAREGFSPAARVPLPYVADSPRAIAGVMGAGLTGFGDCYADLRPDLVFVTGDRYEMLAAAAAAVPFAVPLAHLHGGEITEGAFDDQMRHAITKMSHLHFVATRRSAERVRQMGEEPWRVTVSGAPALDHLRSLEIVSPAALSDRLGVPFDPPPLLVTYHPVTLQYEQTADQIREVLAALDTVDRSIVITYPNADTRNTVIRDAIRTFAAPRANVVAVENLGTAAYFSLMAAAGAMAGNSSSGIVEAPSFRLPVVNIGARQGGRERAANVIDVPAQAPAIREGLARALSETFRSSIADLENPYGDGHAAGRIVDVLRTAPDADRLRQKRFQSVPA